MTFTYGQGHTTVGYTTDGGGCKYFTTEVWTGTESNRSNRLTRPLMGVEHLVRIADNIWPISPPLVSTGTPGAQGRNDNYYSKFLLRGTCLYTLRNQSNETENITAYWCTVRQNQNFVRNESSADANNIYDALGMGFAQKGIYSAAATADNPGLQTKVYTPFDSPVFVKLFKITRMKAIIIKPGEEKRIALKSRTQTVCPAAMTSLVFQSPQQTWGEKSLQYTYRKGSKFLLFKLNARIAGFSGQPENLDPKAITYTTPSVILETVFRYQSKFVWQPQVTHISLTNTGTSNQVSDIMKDEDMKAGPEAEANT